MASRLLLRPLRPQDESDARSAHETLEAAGYNFFLGHDPEEPWAQFVARIQRQQSQIDVERGLVRAAFLAAWVAEEIVGRISIRFELNEYLASAGGHIGYAVLPKHRRRGYATEMLRQGLAVVRAEGVDDVLLTCAADNIGSRTVIERCGGVFESTVHDPREDVLKLRYWVRRHALRQPHSTDGGSIRSTQPPDHIASQNLAGRTHLRAGTELISRRV